MTGQRMSGLDATFLHVEDDVSHMHIGSVGIFDGPQPAFDDLVAMIGAKVPRAPRTTQVVRRYPLDLGRPMWVDDRHFNLEYHVRNTALPAPGGESELRKLVGRIMSQQLDRTKPLWEIWVVGGLRDGQWAVVSKSHHAMVDGISGTDLLAEIINLSPFPEPAPAGAEAAVATSDPASRPAAAPSWSSTVGRIQEALTQFQAVLPSPAIARQATGQVRGIVTGLAAMSGLVRPTPSSSLNGTIGPHRRYAWATTTVDEVKAARKKYGGTFNDVILAMTTNGFRELLLSRGEPVDRVLRTMVPVSVRARDRRGLAVGDGTFANKVSAMFADLPIGVADPIERLHAITAQMAELKDSQEAVAAEALLSLSGFAPPMLLGLGMRLATRMPQRNINTVTTNVPGPQLPLYVQGRQMLKVYPYVPLAGQIRIGVAIFSYNGQVNFGITGDYDTAADLDVLTQAIEEGMRQLSPAT